LGRLAQEKKMSYLELFQKWVNENKTSFPPQGQYSPTLTALSKFAIWLDERCPTSGAVDGGEGAGLPAFSTPEDLSAPEVSSQPTHHH